MKKLLPSEPLVPLEDDGTFPFIGVRFENKDITTVDRGVICHGVNCQGAMNSGVAKFIRQQWPEVFTSYRKFINDNGGIGKHLLSRIDYVTIIDKQLYVANCFTQEFYGYDNKVYAEAGAIVQSLSYAFNFAHRMNLPVYLPHIGGKRGGLNFYQDILPSIYHMADDYAAGVIVCNYEE